MSAPTIYDNGGQTFDRYTIIIGDSVFSMSENALSPQGVNQFCCQSTDLVGLKGFPQNLGNQIRLSDLPTEVKKAINERLNL